MPPTAPVDRQRGAPSIPEQIPELLLRSGRVQVPGPNGPETLRTSDGGIPDVFDVADRLVEQFGRLYVVDLDGIEHADPQLDYIQELSRNAELWVDAGVRRGDEVADLLVAGARRVVVSTSTIRSVEDLRRAWRLSTALAVEIEIVESTVRARSHDWAGRAPRDVATAVRAEGITDLVVSPRGDVPIDWTLIGSLAKEGPLWVDGSYSRAESADLQRAGARGGIFHPTVDELVPPPGAKPA